MVTIAILKSEPIGQLINKIHVPDSILLISSLPGSVSRMHFESIRKPRGSTSVLEALPGKLDIKRHSPSILYLLRFIETAFMFQVVYEAYEMIELRDPYIPGFLGFREVPFICQLFEELARNSPQYMPQV